IPGSDRARAGVDRARAGGNPGFVTVRPGGRFCRHKSIRSLRWRDMGGAAVVRGGLISVAAIGLAACGAAATATPPVQPASPAAKTSGNGALAGNWHELSVTTSPLARNSAGFAYDAATQNVVMSGGRHGCGASATSYTDTWTLDGTVWR